MTTELYRLFDSEGRLLYIGISANAAKRAAQHRVDRKPWRGVEVRMEVEQYDTRSEAAAAEVAAIAAERPLYNVLGNRRGPVRRNSPS